MKNLGPCKCNKPNGWFFHECHIRNNSNFWATNKFKTNARHSVNKFGTLSFHVLHFAFWWNTMLKN